MINKFLLNWSIFFDEKPYMALVLWIIIIFIIALSNRLIKFINNYGGAK